MHRKPSRAHHCTMVACSAYFTNILNTKWKGKSIMDLRHPLVHLSLGWGSRRTAGRLCWARLLTFLPGCLFLQINHVAFGAPLQYLLYTMILHPQARVEQAVQRLCFPSRRRPSSALELTFYCLVLCPLQCEAVPAVSRVGLAVSELVYLMRKSLFHP